MMRQAEMGSWIAVMMVVLGTSAGVLRAQQGQQGKALEFEVAAIKPSDPKLPANSGSSGSRSQFQLNNMPLKQWVEQGFLVSDYALKAPAWLETARFDLDAKLPGDVPKDHNPVPEMLRTLLVERFGLKWHEESQSLSGFELVADKKVLAQPATAEERLQPHGMGWGPTSLSGINMTMAALAEKLGTILGKPVTDATQLSGGYDIKLRWRPDNEAELAQQRQHGKQYGFDVDSLPDTVFTAIREQLGLRLQPAKVPSKVIVVDSINRVPTAN